MKNRYFQGTFKRSMHHFYFIKMRYYRIFRGSWCEPLCSLALVLGGGRAACDPVRLSVVLGGGVLGGGRSLVSNSLALSSCVSVLVEPLPSDDLRSCPKLSGSDVLLLSVPGVHYLTDRINQNKK